MIDKILEHNEEFVNKEKYKPYEASKYPARKLAIVTCMDTRLIELLPAALGIKNGRRQDYQKQLAELSCIPLEVQCAVF